jgi:hypothetical protein
MATTRSRDDYLQRKLQAQESAGAGKYALNVPGPGAYVPFYEDPHMRLQKWGANLMTNTIGVEEDLMGRTRPINYRSVDKFTYLEKAVGTQGVAFPSTQPMVEESRASHPAWTYRDKEWNNWETPILNPQNAPGEYMPGTFGLGKGIIENISTRIIEKNNIDINMSPRDPPSLEYLFPR